MGPRRARQSLDPIPPQFAPRVQAPFGAEVVTYSPMLIDAILKKIVGTKNERELRKLQPRVLAINALEPSVRALTDEQIRGKTFELKERLARGAQLDDVLHEAFALCRESGRRTLGMRHFDVQLIGGMVLHQGKISEMKTGEGKTLVATLAVYLNALAGKGVHVVTVNDYLARRDATWMGPIYRFLGLSVGVIQHDLDDPARQQAYAADVTYGTNNEFGFDYLRDNMKYSLGAMVQRGHHYAIVDEVDSILIDEARTPLIISGPSEESTEIYARADAIIPRLKKEEDYTVDEKARTVALTEEGVEKAEKLLHVDNLYDPGEMELNHAVQQALRAHVLYRRDVDYVVKDGQVIIVDEFTGRLMPGRRWSDGLHQAVEGKEKVKIQKENQTLATITFQNSAASVAAVPVMPASFLYSLKKFWYVIVARVWFSSRTSICSFASTAWWSPSDHRRPCIRRPVNSSTMMISPSITT